jgi:hypothetical protein
MIVCKCIDDSAADLAARNTKLVLAFNVQGRCFPTLQVEKADKKSRTRPAMVVPTFCPFCGKKYVFPKDPIKRHD